MAERGPAYADEAFYLGPAEAEGDLAGSRLYWLVVEGPTKKTYHKHTLWAARCEEGCGNLAEIPTDVIRRQIIDRIWNLEHPDEWDEGEKVVRPLIMHCGCGYRELLRAPRELATAEEAYQFLYLDHAVKRRQWGVPYSVTLETFLLHATHACFLCGERPGVYELPPTLRGPVVAPEAPYNLVDRMYPGAGWNDDNLVTLCPDCHARAAHLGLPGARPLVVPPPPAPSREFQPDRPCTTYQIAPPPPPN